VLAVEGDDGVEGGAEVDVVEGGAEVDVVDGVEGGADGVEGGAEVDVVDGVEGGAEVDVVDGVDSGAEVDGVEGGDEVDVGTPFSTGETKTTVSCAVSGAPLTVRSATKLVEAPNGRTVPGLAIT
jgi:hypothetical protein